MALQVGNSSNFPDLYQGKNRPVVVSTHQLGPRDVLGLLDVLLKQLEEQSAPTVKHELFDWFQKNHERLVRLSLLAPPMPMPKPEQAQRKHLMLMKQDGPGVRHVLESTNVPSYSEGMAAAERMARSLGSCGYVRLLEVVGEIRKELSTEVKEVRIEHFNRS